MTLAEGLSRESDRDRQSELLREIDRWSSLLGQSTERTLEEKVRELKLRVLMLGIPNERLKERNYEEFLRLAFNGAPIAPLQPSLMRARRTLRLSSDELSTLEEVQSGRCAVCGRLLLGSTQPQVDHRTPIAFGGIDEVTNLQLLCRQCNQGKSDLLDWVMGTPYFARDRGNISSKLRYCALARHTSRCVKEGCGRGPDVTELVVTQRVPTSKGGRFVFDNLVVMCQAHAEEARNATLKVCHQRLRGRGLVAAVPFARRVRTT